MINFMHAIEKFKRREFIKLNGSLLLAAAFPSSLLNKKYKPLLSFSTLRLS